MPEATDLYQSMADNNLNNPGIMKYLASFNPFMGSAGEAIKQKVRSEMMRQLQPKSASEKQAMSLVNKAMPVLRGMGTAFRQGRLAANTQHLPQLQPSRLPVSQYLSQLQPSRLPKATPIWRDALNRVSYFTGKNPGGAALGLAPALLTPYFLGSSYDAGKNQVYDSAANDAMGMADLGLMEKFNQPGFMGGLGRAGMAIAPGMGSDMILNQIRQSMFPEVNQQQR
jgi:hypothetical protein